MSAAMPRLGDALRLLDRACPTIARPSGVEFRALWQDVVDRAYAAPEADLPALLILNREVAALASGPDGEGYRRAAAANVARLLARLGESGPPNPPESGGASSAPPRSGRYPDRALGPAVPAPPSPPGFGGVGGAGYEPDEAHWLRWLCAHVRGEPAAAEIIAEWHPSTDAWRVVREGCRTLSAPDGGLAAYAQPSERGNAPLGLLRRLACLAEAGRCLAAGRPQEALALAERAGPDGDLLRAQASPGAVHAGYAAYHAGRLAERCTALGLSHAAARWQARREAWLAIRKSA